MSTQGLQAIMNGTESNSEWWHTSHGIGWNGIYLPAIRNIFSKRIKFKNGYLCSKYSGVQILNEIDWHLPMTSGIEIANVRTDDLGNRKKMDFLLSSGKIDPKRGENFHAGRAYHYFRRPTLVYDATPTHRTRYISTITMLRCRLCFLFAAANAGVNVFVCNTANDRKRGRRILTWLRATVWVCAIWFLFNNSCRSFPLAQLYATLWALTVCFARLSCMASVSLCVFVEMPFIRITNSIFHRISIHVLLWHSIHE